MNQNQVNFDLIHIGHGKCMSTYLQNQWAHDPLTEFYHGMKLGNALSDAYFANRPMNVDLGGLAPDRQRPRILSYESFTYFGVSEANELDKMTQFFSRMDFIAQHLQGEAHTALMIIRNPKKWISSSHAQYVKYGGTENLQGYYDTFRVGILNNLNLADIIRCWSGYNFDLKILPYELFIENEDNFWGLYHQETGLQKPVETPGDALKHNVTKRDEIALKSAVNNVVAALNSPLLDPENATKVGQDVPTVAQHYLKWGIRRFFETASAEQKQQLSTLLTIQAEDEFQALKIPEDDQQFLMENFISPLKSLPAFAPFTDKYVQWG